MTMKAMINRKCRTAISNFQKLRQIRKSLTMEDIALGLAVAHINYANALYAELPESAIKKLQRIQNMTARIVTVVT